MAANLEFRERLSIRLLLIATRMCIRYGDDEIKEMLKDAVKSLKEKD